MTVNSQSVLGKTTSFELRLGSKLFGQKSSSPISANTRNRTAESVAALQRSG